MVLADITLADFEPHELGREADKLSVLVLVVGRELDRLSAADESVRGGGSSSRTLSPAEGLTNMIHRLSLQRRIAPPPTPRLVIQKKLFATDLSPQHNRLSIPISGIDDDFLTDAEKQRLRGENKRTNYLEVKIMAAEEEEISSEKAKLCRWDMRKGEGRKTSSIYAINGKWSCFAKKNNLSVGMLVQLWFFRLRGELCFALVRVDSSA